MCHKVLATILLALLVTLAIAFGSYAAWQEAKTSYAFGIVVEPSGAGTFRVISSHCGETIPGSTSSCVVWVKNESNTKIFLDDWTVSSDRPDITVVKGDPYWKCIEYDNYGYPHFNWTPAANATPGPATFTVVITASAGCP